MKADEKKPANGVAAAAKPLNGSHTVITTKAEKEAAKTETKSSIPAIDKLLNEVTVLNSRIENREHLLESQRKLKSFNPTVTESNCTLIIQDNRGNQFKTTHSEALKMVIGNYVAMVDAKLREVESDIAHLAGKLAG